VFRIQLMTIGANGSKQQNVLHLASRCNSEKDKR